MNLNKSTLFMNIKTNISKWGFSKQGLFNNSRGEWYLFSQILLILLHLTPPYPKIDKIGFSGKEQQVLMNLTTLFAISGSPLCTESKSEFKYFLS